MTLKTFHTSLVAQPHFTLRLARRDFSMLVISYLYFCPQNAVDILRLPNPVLLLNRS